MFPKFVYLDAKIIPYQKAAVPVLTHGLHYGDSAFEGIRFYKTKKGPAVFRFDDHLKRLFYSFKVLTARNFPFSSKEIKQTTANLVRKNKLEEGYIRPLAFLGEKMGLSLNDLDARLLIIVFPWGRYLKKNGIKVKISKIRRMHPQTFYPKAKISGYYVNSILANSEALKAGFDEALLLDFKGNIAEGPGENIFIIKNSALYTPKNGSILPGITRDTVMKIAKALKLRVIEKDLKPDFLFRADEAFFTGTAAEITPIIQVNNIKINGGKVGPISDILKNAYLKIVRGENKKYKKWLSYI